MSESEVRKYLRFVNKGCEFDILPRNLYNLRQYFPRKVACKGFLDISQEMFFSESGGSK